MSPPINLRQFLELLRSNKEVVDVFEEVDPNLEIPEIHRRIAAVEGPTLFFHNVKGSSFPVVTNLFGSLKRIELAFPHRPDKLIGDLTKFLTTEFPPSIRKIWSSRKTLKSLLKIGTKKFAKAPVLERQLSPQLESLPLLKTWPLDGGHFITLPLVYTESPQHGTPNLGMYRIQRYDQTSCGLHFQIQKGGGFHFHQAEMLNQDLPVSIFIGGPPALILSAITPLPENISELLICSLLLGKKLSLTSIDEHSHSMISECEFALIGKAPAHKRRMEGPFGDHYGYYSLQHEFPIFECQKIFHRKDAVYPATVVGKPKQEDFYIGEYLQKLLSPLFPIVMPGVSNLWSYGESGFHSVSAAVVKERYYRESMHSGFRILGEGQLSLTKFLFITNQSVDLKNFKLTLQTILERFKPETDLFIFANLSLDTLDYTGPALNKGSRGIMLGVGEKIRDLPQQYSEGLPSKVKTIETYIPGCLVLDGEKELSIPNILKHKGFQKWPLLILVDDAKHTVKHDTNFLWIVFTRFDPASDIFASETTVVKNHLCFKGPILIDARMKPSYPPIVQPDPETESLVTKKWLNYFPKGMEMGDSNLGHIID